MTCDSDMLKNISISDQAAKLSIHNESITEKIRMLRDDIHQLFPSGPYNGNNSISSTQFDISCS